MLAAAQLPGLSACARLFLHIVTAAALLALGWHATSCPPNCPGNEKGRPARGPGDAPTVVLACVAILALLLTAVAGCVTKSQRMGADGRLIETYHVDPRLAAASNAVVGGLKNAGDVVPEADMASKAAAMVFGLIGLASAAYARHKTVVAQSLADAVVHSGPEVHAAVHKAAADRDTTGQVRVLLARRIKAEG
jgi:hypothetical protein